MIMKKMSILLYCLTVVGAAAQQALAEDSRESQLSNRLAKASLLSLSEGDPNEIVKRNFAYSGIAVAAFKTDNLLQLVNPFAPAKYGPSENNVLRDLKTGRLSGCKLFQIQF
jgi:hypothetical protein